jgi:hypothetical protein
VVQMSGVKRLAWCLMTALALALVGLVPAASVRADDQATTMIQLESPASGPPASTRLMVTGWAADPTGDGVGVDAVRVYLGDPNVDGQDLGAATFGQPRPDVATTLGDSRFTNSGFQLAVELPAGDYTLTIYAHRNTAGTDDGWVVYSTSFTASASVRPDPRAVALLGGDQPPVRTANPSSNGAIVAGGGRTGTADVPFSATNDGGAIRTTVSNRNDPIPLDPIIPGATSSYSPGRNEAELADATGSGSGIRISVASDSGVGGNGSTYRTGNVSRTGGQGNACPGPNCPANTQNMNQQLQNMTPDMLRQITGYSIPGFGNSTPCVPTSQANAPGACNPQTGSSQAPGAPTGIQQLQAQTAAAQQAANDRPVFTPAGNTGPQCLLSTGNGQCANQAGSAGPLGSTCLRFVGQQCAYYGQPPATASAAPGQAPNALAGQPGLAGGAPGMANPLQTAGLGAAGCAQWGGSGQCLQPTSAGSPGAAGGNNLLAGLSATNPAGLLPAGAGTVTSLVQQQASVPLTNTASSGQSSLYQSTTSPGQSSLYQATSPTAPSPYLASTTSPTTASPYGALPLPASSGTGGSGVCLQFGAGGACVRSQ